eukprot:TRINITY_DN27512_c0_g1_i2.p1 TRINITY_DN27512_c0_g1~~TRINITY_DN27512_c0_g1_i2.p1  ORF type:complete len:563 (-),score=147.34 TRINITY_DN27512_c0_g1_i2:87-1775(-)
MSAQVVTSSVREQSFAEAKHFLVQADAAKDCKDYVKCNKYAEEALSKFKELNDAKGSAEALRRSIGARLANNDLKVEEAESLIQEAMNAQSNERTGVKSLLLLSRAELRLLKGQADLALEDSLEAESMFECIHETSLQCYVLYTVVVNAYLKLHRLPEALEASLKALGLAQQSKVKKDEANAWYGLATARLAGNDSDAHSAMDKARCMFRELNDRRAEASVLHLFAALHLSRNDPQGAMRFFREALLLSREEGLGGHETSALEKIYEIASGSPGLFHTTAEEALSRAKERGNISEIAEAAMMVMGVRKGAGASQAALEIAKDMANTFGSSGDTANQARMLYRIAELSPHNDEALSAAQQSLSIFEGLRDTDGQASVRLSLDRLFVERGQAMKAPSRKDALRMLTQLGSSLTEKDAKTCKSLLESLEACGNVLQPEEIKVTIANAAREDPNGTMAFLESLSLDGKSQAHQQLSGEKAKMTPSQVYYSKVDSTGLTYGPSFRMVNHSYAKVSGTEAYGVLEEEEGAGEWHNFQAFPLHHLEATMSHALNQLPAASNQASTSLCA